MAEVTATQEVVGKHTEYILTAPVSRGYFFPQPKNGWLNGVTRISALYVWTTENGLTCLWPCNPAGELIADAGVNDIPNAEFGALCLAYLKQLGALRQPDEPLPTVEAVFGHVAAEYPCGWDSSSEFAKLAQFVEAHGLTTQFAAWLEQEARAELAAYFGAAPDEPPEPASGPFFCTECSSEMVWDEIAGTYHCSECGYEDDFPPDVKPVPGFVLGGLGISITCQCGYELLPPAEGGRVICGHCGQAHNFTLDRQPRPGYNMGIPPDMQPDVDHG